MAVTLSKALVLFLSISFLTSTAYKYFVQKKKKEKQKETNEVIMFSYEECELKKSKYSRCTITKSMDRFLHYLASPKYSLDVCIYVFTNSDIANVLLKLHYKGIKIRIIIDADMAYCTGSNLRRMERQGIPVRWMKSTNLMHHKFCIIDAVNIDDVHPLVIAGSLNWTNQALCGNWENVLVTSQADLVNQFKTEFEKLWLQFTPITS
ncbi:uncharacterized protein LOC101742165 [Bombyx mori]|uniref:Mitochondrial cardiolipin hydrolase n=1 Tax=Bombyx mori TaxID=7091 RepID=A0A8R1WIA5_BOMMO|nr:mitochondrial cardiolipin hydrolase [Bombyx mori]